MSCSSAAEAVVLGRYAFETIAHCTANEEAAAAAAMEEAPIATLPFAHLPSVGTWMHRLPRQDEEAMESEMALLRQTDSAACLTTCDESSENERGAEEEEPQTPRSLASELFQKKVAGALASVIGVAQHGAGRVVGAAESGADAVCQKWQATDDVATKALHASEEFLSRKSSAISEVATEKKDFVQKTVTGKARQGYAFAVEKTQPIRQAAGYAKDKLENVTDVIHDKTSAHVQAGGEAAERVSNKIADGIGMISGKAEDLTATMAAKANDGIRLISAKTAAVKQTSKAAMWATRASGA